MSERNRVLIGDVLVQTMTLQIHAMRASGERKTFDVVTFKVEDGKAGTTAANAWNLANGILRAAEEAARWEGQR